MTSPTPMTAATTLPLTGAPKRTRLSLAFGITAAALILAMASGCSANQPPAFDATAGSTTSGATTPGVGPSGPAAAGAATPSMESTPVATTALAVSTSGSHSCRINQDGTVDCWGANMAGQLGDGTQTNQLLPVRVCNLAGATAIATGPQFTCALLTGGTVDCWGANQYGQLGSATVNAEPIPQPVPNVSGAASIAVGGPEACAVLSSGPLTCWGLTLDEKNGAAVVVAPTPVAGLGNVTAVSLGNNYSRAVTADGSVFCWGDDGYGQLGDGASAGLRPTPAPVPGLAGATSITSGNAHVCAILADKSVKCWGWNRFGQLGDGTTDDRSTPTLPRVLTTVTSLSAGGTDTCAVDAGTVKCWGDNPYGSLGTGGNFQLNEPTPVAGLVPTQPAAPAPEATATATGLALSLRGGGMLPPPAPAEVRSKLTEPQIAGIGAKCPLEKSGVPGFDQALRDMYDSLAEQIYSNEANCPLVKSLIYTWMASGYTPPAG